jgi:hypothetical protein
MEPYAWVRNDPGAGNDAALKMAVYCNLPRYLISARLYPDHGMFPPEELIVLPMRLLRRFAHQRACLEFNPNYLLK